MSLLREQPLGTRIHGAILREKIWGFVSCLVSFNAHMAFFEFGSHPFLMGHGSDGNFPMINVI